MEILGITSQSSVALFHDIICVGWHQTYEEELFL